MNEVPLYDQRGREREVNLEGIDAERDNECLAAVRDNPRHCPSNRVPVVTLPARLSRLNRGEYL